MDQPSLLFLGTGTAFHADGRGSQCILARPRHAGAFLVDCGPTALAAAMRFRAPTREIDRLFVTHLHGDHVAGWPFLLLQLGLADGRTRPFEVWGPAGTRDCLEGLARLCYGDLLQTGRLGFEVHYRELPVAPRSALAAGSLGFDVVPVAHHPSSIGYRFTVDGKRIAVTGDTRWCEGLETLARDADLLLCECSSVAPTGLAHLSLRELRDGLGRLGGGEVVLVHLTDEVALALAADPLPGVLAAHDGMALGW